jgi:uncharacterized protein YukE
MAAMVVGLEILLAVGIVVVAASFALVTADRVSARNLVAAAGALGVLGAATLTVMAVGLAIDRWSWRELAVTAGGFVAAACAEIGALAYLRSLERSRSIEAVGTRLLERLDTALAAHSEVRIAELEQTLARERAETIHVLAAQERALRDEHRTELERRAEEGRTQLTEAVTTAQQRLEQRLSAWSSDLERAQQQLKARLEELIRRQADALQAHEARLADHAREVVSLGEDQQTQIAKIRTEFERVVAEAYEAGKADIDVHAVERRRALHEVGERLRTRERSMREQIEREEAELRAQLATAVAEVERRHIEQLERALDRAVVRLSEDAERRFDKQLRESREKTAERLSRELEISMEHFMKAAESEVVNRIAESAQGSASRFQRQIDDLVRAAEIQTGISNERIGTLTERLERSLEAAHERLNAFEAHVELELSTKLGEIERALRSAGQTAERAQSRS